MDTFEFTDGKRYRLRFEHDQLPQDLPWMHVHPTLGAVPIVATTCAVVEPADKALRSAAIEFRGTSRCSAFDHFEKATGRAVALDKLCRLLPRADAGKVKHAYYSRKRVR